MLMWNKNAMEHSFIVLQISLIIIHHGKIKRMIRSF